MMAKHHNPGKSIKSKLRTRHEREIQQLPSVQTGGDGINGNKIEQSLEVHADGMLHQSYSPLKNLGAHSVSSLSKHLV